MLFIQRRDAENAEANAEKHKGNMLSEVAWPATTNVFVLFISTLPLRCLRLCVEEPASVAD